MMKHVIGILKNSMLDQYIETILDALKNMGMQGPRVFLTLGRD